MFRPEIVDDPQNQEDHVDGQSNVVAKELDPRDVFGSRSDVANADQPLSAAVTVKVRDQQQRSDHGEKAALRCALQSRLRRHQGNGGKNDIINSNKMAVKPQTARMIGKEEKPAATKPGR